MNDLVKRTNSYERITDMLFFGAFASYILFLGNHLVITDRRTHPEDYVKTTEEVREYLDLREKINYINIQPNYVEVNHIKTGLECFFSENLPNEEHVSGMKEYIEDVERVRKTKDRLTAPLAGILALCLTGLLGYNKMINRK